MLSKKNSMVTMVTDEFLENRIILQKIVATIGFIWFFWFQKCILLYIFVQVFLVMRCIRNHISFFRLGLTPTLTCEYSPIWKFVTKYNREDAYSHTWGIFIQDTAYFIVIQWSMTLCFIESQWNLLYPIWKYFTYGSLQPL